MICWSLAILLVWLALMIGCKSEFESEATAKKRVDLQGKKVTLLHVASHTGAAEHYTERFHQETGAIVELRVAGYGDLMNVIEDDWQSSEPQIDILQILYHDLSSLVTRGMVTDLSEFYADHHGVIEPEDYLPNVLDAYAVRDGNYYALPYDFDNHVVFYRKSILRQHQLSPPETWDDFSEIARTITEREREGGIYGTAIMAHPSPMFAIGSYMNRLVTCGGSLFDAGGTPTLTSPESVQALSYLVEHASYALPDPVETDFDVSRFAFLSGRAAMVEQWTDVGIMAEDANMSTIAGDWGAVQLPLGTGARAQAGTALNAGWVLAVSSKSPHAEIAREFLLTVANRDNELQGNLINGGLDPTRKSVLTSAAYRAFAPEVASAKQASLQRAVSLPTGPRAQELLHALATGIIRAVQGEKQPEEALAEVQATWKKVLAQPLSAAVDGKTSY